MSTPASPKRLVRLHSNNRTKTLLRAQASPSPKKRVTIHTLPRGGLPAVPAAAPAAATPITPASPSGTGFKADLLPPAAARATPEASKRLPRGEKEIQLYTNNTPNGYKIAIFLEEAGIPYDLHVIDLESKQQFEPEFVDVSPNSKIPAIVDLKPASGAESLAVFESGAILTYLATKYGKFMPADAEGQAAVLQWVFFQAAAVGPMAGQLVHFVKVAKEDIPYAKTRFMDETRRLMRVVEKRLAESPFLAGPEYSIADMMLFPWLVALRTRMGVLKEEHMGFPVPNITRWVDDIFRRPAVSRVMGVN